jgi:hypothetical protein
MWELKRQVGSARTFVFKDADRERIKLRFSAYKDDEFKIVILSYFQDKNYTITVKVPSGELEDVKREAVNYFKKIRKKERILIRNIEKAESAYKVFFDNISEKEGEK